MPLARLRQPAIAAALASFLLVVGGCAGLGLFDSREEPPPLPATIPQLHAAIAVERSRLMDLVSEPAGEEERWNANADVMVVIAARLSRLQDALAALEQQRQAGATQREDEAPPP